MIPLTKSSPRGPARVRLVVIHTAEGARTAHDLGAYFSGPVEASSHVGIDERVIQQYLPYERAAWTMLAANAIADQAELCGFAHWTRQQWLTEHTGMLSNAARWIRERCQARAIPIRKLTPAQVAAGDAGVCGHWDWTVGMRDGTHTDPGSGFPWDVVIAAAADPALTLPTPPPAPLQVPPAPPRRSMEDEIMYIKCRPDPTGPIWLALLSGPFFVGLGSPGEQESADGEIRAGAPVQWVELGTWQELDRRSHALTDSPRPVSIARDNPPAPPPPRP